MRFYADISERKKAEEAIRDCLPESLPGLAVGKSLLQIPDPIIYLQILVTFRQEHADVLPLRTAMEKRRIDTAESIVHNLKGIAGNIGATKVRKIAGSFEENLRNGGIRTIAHAETLLAELSSALKESDEAAAILLKTIAATVSEAVSTPDAPKKNRLKTKDWAPLLDELKTQLENDSIAAEALAYQLMEELRHTPFEKKAEKLAAIVAKYDYSASLAMIQKWKKEKKS